MTLLESDLTRNRLELREDVRREVAKRHDRILRCANATDDDDTHPAL